MYSAIFGMLWSVWTSTFIPFLSVFVATGNSTCPQTGAPISTAASNAKAALPIHLVFIFSPCETAVTLNTKSFAILGLVLHDYLLNVAASVPAQKLLHS